MAIVVADIGVVHGDGTASVLFMLSILTGLIMLVAGFLKAGSVLRFVSNAVMVGFINAVGINIILGQFHNFTGYEAEGSNRVTRAFDSLLSLGEAHWPTGHACDDATTWVAEHGDKDASETSDSGDGSDTDTSEGPDG